MNIICKKCKKVVANAHFNRKFCSYKCKRSYNYSKNYEKERIAYKKYYDNNKEYHLERAKRYYHQVDKSHLRKINNKATYKYKDKVRFDGKRQQILKLHNHQCDFCGKKDGLCIHHKDGISYHNSPKANNDFENLLVLCRSCHSTLHWQLRKEPPVKSLHSSKKISS